MIRNLKVLGLALVAVLAMSAMVASAAGAAQFTAPAGTTIQAEDTGAIKFTITGQEVVCKKAVFHGVASSESPLTRITVNPTYNECTGAFFNATITGFGQFGETKKCDFVLDADGTADLVCDSGADVTIDAGPCVVHIPAQNNLGTITYTNDGGKVDLDINITEIQASHTDGFLCPFAGSSSGKNGAMHGTAEAIGDGGSTSISYDA